MWFYSYANIPYFIYVMVVSTKGVAPAQHCTLLELRQTDSDVLPNQSQLVSGSVQLYTAASPLRHHKSSRGI